MPNSKIVQGSYFRWRLFRRPDADIWEADGRSNDPALGRYTLHPDWSTALDRLKKLDVVKAVEHGMASPSELTDGPGPMLALEEGRRIYLKHLDRPAVMRGVKPATRKRYKPVFDKFEKFARAQGVTCWNGVKRRVLEDYGAWLEEQDYCYATQYLELTTVKQVLNHLVECCHVPKSCQFDLPLERPDQTTTYCYTDEEMDAMIDHCRRTEGLGWLGDIIVGLMCLGLRISELTQLTWSNVDLVSGMVTLPDRSRAGTKTQRAKAPSTKGGRSRSLPIPPMLRRQLESMDRRDDGRVFRGPTGAAVVSDVVRSNLVDKVIAPLQHRFPAPAGQKGFADGRLHSMRHYFCSTCANSGVSEQTLRHWLGHRSSRMVQHYYHLHDEESKRQMQRVNFLGQALPAKEPAASAETNHQETPNPQQTQEGLDQRRTA